LCLPPPESYALSDPHLRFCICFLEMRGRKT
jgi:hypothetical protein